jgi:lantibiotic modifying enzyme
MGAVMDFIDGSGWITGLPHGIEAPGLLVGLAGTGYGMLRLAAPERVPSALALAPAGG